VPNGARKSSTEIPSTPSPLATRTCTRASRNHRYSGSDAGLARPGCIPLSCPSCVGAIGSSFSGGPVCPSVGYGGIVCGDARRY
jgi:hypothetical protein